VCGKASITFPHTEVFLMQNPTPRPHRR
jgi:hypothetical protein